METTLSKIIFSKNFFLYLFSILILILLNITQAYLFAPLFPFQDDTLFNLRWIISDEPIAETGNHQHILRWGSYIFFYFLDLFNSLNYSTIIVTSLIVYTTAGVLFLYFVHFNFGFLFSLIFLVLWLTNLSINNELFSHSINTLTLFFLSILLLLLSNIKYLKDYTFAYCLILSVTIFVLYGIKETNIFFFILLIFFREFYKYPKYIFYLLSFIVLFFTFETLFIYYFSNYEIKYGRILSLTNIGHIDDMVDGFTSGAVKKFTSFEQFFSPFYRWHITDSWNSIIFYSTVVISIFAIFNTQNENHINKFQYIYLLVLSFFIFNTFFIISLFPLVMGQVHESRYLTPLLPLSFIVLIIFLHNNLKASKQMVVLIFLLGIVFFTFLSKPTHKLLFEDQRYSLAAVKNNYKFSYSQRQNDYFKLFKNLDSYDCIQINKFNHHVAKMLINEQVLTGANLYFDYLIIPENKKRFDHSSTFFWKFKTMQDNSGKTSVWIRDNYIVKKDDVEKCSKTIYLKNNLIMF